MTTKLTLNRLVAEFWSLLSESCPNFEGFPIARRNKPQIPMSTKYPPIRAKKSRRKINWAMQNAPQSSHRGVAAMTSRVIDQVSSMSSLSSNYSKPNEKRCRSCWRDDIHIPVEFPPLIVGFLTVATLGLFLLVKPSRCICCGTKRVF